jgi:hypothetical protein
MVENQTNTQVWEDSSLCPEASTKTAVQEFHLRYSYVWPAADLTLQSQWWRSSLPSGYGEFRGPDMDRPSHPDKVNFSALTAISIGCSAAPLHWSWTWICFKTFHMCVFIYLSKMDNTYHVLVHYNMSIACLCLSLGSNCNYTLLSTVFYFDHA